MTVDIAKDRTSYATYDPTGRIQTSTDAEGSITTYLYDGLNRVVRTEIKDGDLSNGDDGLRFTRTFYNRAGKVEGVLDADGYFVENQYDTAGRLRKTIAYAKVSEISIRESADFTTLQVNVSSDATLNAKNKINRFIYDGQNRVIATINAEGYLTETQYNLDGQVSGIIRYANTVSSTLLDKNTLGELRPAVDAKDQTEGYSYNKKGQLSSSTDLNGITTTYRYDVAGNLVETNRGVIDARRTYTSYDAAGRTKSTVDGIGSGELGTNATQSAVDLKAATKGHRFIYDSAGRVTQSIDANGNTTTYYYDLAGRQRFVINAAGGVQESQYNAFGDVSQSIRYVNTLSTTDLASLTGGLVSNSTIETLVANLSDSSKDSATTFNYDKRGLVLEAVRQVLNSTGTISSYKTLM